MNFCKDAEGLGPFSPSRLLDFTVCFEELVLKQVLNSVALLALVVFGLKSTRQSALVIRKSLRYYAKILICVGLAAVAMVQSLEKIYLSVDVAAYLASAVVHHLEHFYNPISSSFLLLFWLAQSILRIIFLRTLLLTGQDLYLCLTELILILLVFSVECLPKEESLYDDIQERNPEESANIFSRISFHWMTSLMKLGHHKILDGSDLFNLKKEDTAQYNDANFQKNLTKQLVSKRPSLAFALIRTYGLKFIASSFYKVVQDLLQFTQPQLLNLMMAFVSTFDRSKPNSIEIGIGISVLMLFTAITQTCFLHQYFHEAFMLNMNVRSALITAVYRKAMKLSSNSKQQSTVGEITNLMAVDSQKIGDLFNNLNMVWSGPLQMILAITLLYRTLGSSVFAGIAVMVAMIPINALMATKSRDLNRVHMGIKDTRTKLMDEVLNGIKVIKLYGWESSFIERITNVRDKELDNLKRIWYWGSVSSFTWTVTPFLVSFVTFAIYSIGSEPLTSQKIFVSLSLFNLLSFPLAMFPGMIASLVEASVSVNRLLNFFLLEEQAVDAVILERLPPAEANGSNKPIERLSISKASFSWRDDGIPVLGPLSLSVADGQILAVVGAVGSGKSTLISAILGESYKISGNVTVRGTIAYVPQDAWIMNCTLRDNILFGLPYDAKYYEQVLEGCGLLQDLDSLVNGDMTEIGERGINLSGGQKQRVSLARAVYSKADFYLIDDALSAVDAHVGKHIFDHVFSSRGLLAKKARILVTHGIQYLNGCDQVCLLVNGEIGEFGSYKGLMERKNLLFNLVKDFGKKKEHGEDEPTPAKSEASLFKSKKQVTFGTEVEKNTGGGIITCEISAKGKVKFDVYKSYAFACQYRYVFVFIGFAILTQSLQIGQNVLLSYWAEFNDRKQRLAQIFDPESPFSWLTGYAVIGMFFCISSVAEILSIYIFCSIKGSKVLHDNMLVNVLRLPQSFFDTTPIGRVINRFSKDIFTIDEILPRSFFMFGRTFLGVISVLAVNMIGNPYYVFLALPLGIIYHFIQKFYLATSRELKRLDSTTKSPIYQNFQETLFGVSSIRAYSQQQRFIDKNQERVDLNQRAYYPSVASNRWLAVRLEMIGAMIVFGSAFSGVVALYFGTIISSSIIGLMIVYSLNVTQALNWMVRQSCEIETNIVSVERVKEYSEIPQEAPAEILETDPGANWPSKGVISFVGYAARYRAGLDLIVKDLNFDVKSHEKIGIVGRTGAGKSTLTLSLFRIIEAAAGKVIIDGVDISTIGLTKLRSNISIIPQDPVLFNSTVRYNLDPFELYTDQDIWEALEKVNLKSVIAGNPLGLSQMVSPNGENFSVGQRQLICLGRALVRKAKILVMDEATAAIDVETDAIIQATIRREMKECTVLTIAHRINTVMDSDRILVMSNGKVAEFDTPANLLQNKSSLFYSLAKEAGQI